MRTEYDVNAVITAVAEEGNPAAEVLAAIAYHYPQLGSSISWATRIPRSISSSGTSFPPEGAGARSGVSAFGSGPRRTRIWGKSRCGGRCWRRFRRPWTNGRTGRSTSSRRSG